MGAQPNRDWQSREEPVCEDMAFQRRFWRVQTAGWAVAAVVILGALLGLFSDGPLSHTRRGQELSLEYQRFYRSGASASFVVALETGQNEVVLSNRLAEDMVLETIRPTPAHTSAGPDGMHFVFDASAGGRVFFGIRPASFGMVAGTISAGKRSVPIKIFVYP